MQRAIPWLIAVVAIVAFGVTFSELHKARDRYWQLALFQSHDHMHRGSRVFIIRAALAGLDRPIVVIGDSITEMARFPETIDGRPVVNAGIGGAMSGDFQKIAPLILHDCAPSMIVVALGANDGLASLRSDYAPLLASLKKFAPHLLAVAVTPQDDADAKNAEILAASERENVPFIKPQIPSYSTLADRIHLTNAASRQWVSALVAAIPGAGS